MPSGRSRSLPDDFDVADGERACSSPQSSRCQRRPSPAVGSVLLKRCGVSHGAVREAEIFDFGRKSRPEGRKFRIAVLPAGAGCDEGIQCELLNWTNYAS